MEPVTLALGSLLLGGLLSRKQKAPSPFLTPEDKAIYEAIYKDIYNMLYTTDPKTKKPVLKGDPSDILIEYLYGPAFRSMAMAMEDHKKTLANTLAAMGASGATAQALAQLDRQFLQDLFSFQAQARRAPLDLAQTILGAAPVAIQTTGRPPTDLSDIGILIALLADAFKPKTALPLTGYTPRPAPLTDFLYDRNLFRYSLP